MKKTPSSSTQHKASEAPVLCCGESKLNSIILEKNLFAKKSQEIVDWKSRLGKRRFGKCKKKVKTKSKKVKKKKKKKKKKLICPSRKVEKKNRFSGWYLVVGCKN